MKKKDRISEREYQGRLESLLKSTFTTQAAEVTRDRNQKAEGAEKEGRKQFWVHEIKHGGFRLMVRPARAFYETTLVGG
jgi:hypothetical protein